MKDHRKHADLARRPPGEFGVNELSFVGAPCGYIQELSRGIAKEYGNKLRISYVDATHGKSDEGVTLDNFYSIFMDNIAHRTFNVQQNPNPLQRRWWFNDSDLVIVNGNHFHASKQIVIIDPVKYDSLKRKIDRLDNIAGIVLRDGTDAIFDFISDLIANDVPVFRENDKADLYNWLARQLEPPAIKALVLAGGKSQRMGHDKTAIAFHGIPHRTYLAKLLSSFCDDVFTSIRHDQANPEDDFSGIRDAFVGLGPYGGILSAFQHDPNAAWLVVASDLPFVSVETIDFLLLGRNPSKLATAFNNKTTGFPDPLITLWEPRAYPVMLQFLSQGYSCPRKVLINSDVELLDGDQQWLTNVNTPEDLKMAEEILRTRATDQS